MTSLSGLLESYRDYLFLHQAINSKQLALKRFDERLRACPEAAHAEAVVFQYLRVRGLDPRLLEDLSSGGFDFECHGFQPHFAVEVTAITDETMRRAGNMKAVLSTLRSRLSTKSSNAQRHSYTGPRVLAITAEAEGALLLEAAQQFLTGELTIRVDITPDGPVGDSYVATDLKNAAYLQPSADGISAFRNTYAFVLLFAVGGESSRVFGVRHPQPDVPLPISAFPSVPFGQVTWPIRNNELSVEWFISYPQPDKCSYRTIQLTDSELGSGVR